MPENPARTHEPAGFSLHFEPAGNARRHRQSASDTGMVTITVDGRPQPMLAAQLVAASAAGGLAQAATAELVLALPPPLDGDAAASIFATARLGATLRLTVDPDSPALFTGEINALTQDFRADRSPRLEIHAEDRLATLGRTMASGAHHDQTPLAAIRAVVHRHGFRLTGEVVDGDRREVIVQAAESDLAFIRRLAAELDAAVLADDNAALRLVDRSTTPEPQHRLAIGETLLAFRLTADAAALPGTLTMLGWNPWTQQLLRVTRDLPQVVAPPLETTPRGEVLMADPSLAHEAQMAARLRAFLSSANRRSVIATGTCSAAVPLRGGDVVAIDGVGPRAAGAYRIEWARHDFSMDDGWRTSFVASRPMPATGQRGVADADRHAGDSARPDPLPRPPLRPVGPIAGTPGLIRRPGG
jgi:phage protein D